MRTNELRQTFLDYFAAKGHTIVPSSSLIPEKDPTLLFTNAGMNQFKNVFLGQETRPYTQATSAQCCVRAGGKHNDLENVGFTARHHTFFEMLGNFSFGDYFKREAIAYAWEFLTEVLKIPVEKLSVTVYEDDVETEEIWLKEIKINPKQLSRCGAEDNFWSMGDTGPCGPCSEIFYDHGPKIQSTDDRYVEIWNLVFMQYNRSIDGKLTPLPKPSVDTGMGLERISAIMQGAHSNYDIDIFQNLIKAIHKYSKEKDSPSFKVIADHIRACVFLIAAGVTPSNDGRGYVLRRIIRRAIRHGNKLGIHTPFFHKLVAPLVKEMGQAYPKIKTSQQHIEHALQIEEQQFAITLEQGLKILAEEIAKTPDSVLPGNVVFRLYDTYGFPPDLTRDIAQEHDLTIDEQGFTREMLEQRAKSKHAHKFSVDYTKTLQLPGATEFIGYQQMEGKAKIIALLHKDNKVDFLRTGDQGAVILNKTPFYAEAGGQVGDTGAIYTDNSLFQVTDTEKQGDIYLHYGYVKAGSLEPNYEVSTKVDAEHRQAVNLNHSATHLLHAALREILGPHVEQKGSLVNAEHLRFDFSHLNAVTAKQIKAVETIVNQQIRANLPVNTDLMSLDEAKKQGAMALFSEKYADKVRVVNIGDLSIELCGGTHIQATGSIGLFKIITETGIAAGIRRIEALTGERTCEYLEKLATEVNAVATLLKTEPHRIVTKVNQLLEQTKNTAKEVAQLKGQISHLTSNDLTADTQEIAGIKILATKLENADMQTLRNTIDQLKDKLNPAVILLASVIGNKIHLAAGISKDCTDKLHAGKLMEYVAEQLGGKGGGRPDMAQGGGTEIQNLDDALNSVFNWVKKQL